MSPSVDAVRVDRPIATMLESCLDWIAAREDASSSTRDDATELDAAPDGETHPDASDLDAAFDDAPPTPLVDGGAHTECRLPVVRALHLPEDRVLLTLDAGQPCVAVPAERQCREFVYSLHIERRTEIVILTTFDSTEHYVRPSVRRTCDDRATQLVAIERTIGSRNKQFLLDPGDYFVVADLHARPGRSANLSIRGSDPPANFAPADAITIPTCGTLRGQSSAGGPWACTLQSADYSSPNTGAYLYYRVHVPAGNILALHASTAVSYSRTRGGGRDYCLTGVNLPGGTGYLEDPQPFDREWVGARRSTSRRQCVRRRPMRIARTLRR